MIGKEDNTVNLGQQIQDKLMVNATDFDAVADELSIVINASDLPAGASIGGKISTLSMVNTCLKAR